MYNKVFFFLFLVSTLAACPGKNLNPTFKNSDKLAVEKVLDAQKYFLYNLNSTVNYKALAKVSLETERGVQSFRQAIIFANPDKFRLEMLPSTGAYAFAIFVAKDSKATYLDTSAKTYIQSDLSPANIARVLRIPAELEEARAILSGVVPRKYFSLDSNDSLLMYKSNSPDECVLVSKNMRYIAWLNCDTNLISRFELRNTFNDKVILKGNYAEYFEIKDNTKLPKRIIFELPKDNAKVSFDFSHQSLPGVVKNELFEVEIPDDFSLLEGRESEEF